MDNKIRYEIKVNGKRIGLVDANNPNTTRAEFIAFARRQFEAVIDEARDTVEIIRLTPPQSETVRNHPARDKQNNKYIDAILDRHISNMIATYGAERLFKILEAVHGLKRPETKAS